MNGDSLVTRKPQVSVSELPYNPENREYGILETLSYSSRISHDQQGRSPLAIWRAEREKQDQSEQKEKSRSFLSKLAKMGHTSCFYQANFGLNYKVPRHTTLFLCSFDHSKFLQQSQRYTKAKEFIPMLGEELKGLFSKQRDLYLRLIEAGIAKEDARYILPLSMGATHIHQNTNFIALANVFRVVDSDNTLIPPLTKKIIERALSQLGEEEPHLFDQDLIELYNQNEKAYPVANLFARRNKWVKKAASLTDLSGAVESFSLEVNHELKSKAKAGNDQALSFLNLSNDCETVRGYLAPMSLAAWHQFMRNDTVHNAVETIYDAADREEVIVPDSIQQSEFLEDYLDIFKESMQAYRHQKNKYDAARAVEAIPHGLEVNVAFSLDGFNLVRGFIKDRAQEAAQWEIREIARSIRSNLD